MNGLRVRKPLHARRPQVSVDRAAIQRTSADAFNVFGMMAATAPAAIPWVCVTIVVGSLLSAGVRLTDAHGGLPVVSETPVTAIASWRLPL